MQFTGCKIISQVQFNKFTNHKWYCTFAYRREREKERSKKEKEENIYLE